MNTIVARIARTPTAAALLLAAGSQLGCKDDASCDAVVDHTLSLMPAEFKENADKKDMIAKCEKMPVEVRTCALQADQLEAMAACRSKANK